MTLTQAKEKGGPYDFSGYPATTVKDAPEDFFFKFENTSSSRVGHLELSDVTFGKLKDFEIRWTMGKDDLTRRLRRGIYRFGLAPGSHLVLKAVVRPETSHARELCLAPRLDLPGTSDYLIGGVYINDDGVCG